MKWTFYYYCSKTVDNILGFSVLTLHFWLFNNLKLYMCIPLRIDQGLGWVFDTLMALELYQLLWQAPSLFTFPMAPFGRGVPLGIPEIEQIQELFLLGWALEKVMQGEKAVWAFSFAHWSRDQLWAGAITQGDLLSLSRAVPGWKAAGCYNTGFPVCRKQVWFLLSFWLYSHLNSNQHFLKLGARQGLLRFRLGNPWG